MRNPYAPPKAEVGGAEPARLPRGVRVLRGFAVGLNALIGITPLMFLVLTSRALIAAVVYTALVVLWNGTSLLALTTRMAPRLVFWSAILVNALALALFGYLFFASGRSDPGVGLLFILPAILNLVAIDELRRARLRLAHPAP